MSSLSPYLPAHHLPPARYALAHSRFALTLGNVLGSVGGDAPPPVPPPTPQELCPPAARS